VTVPLRVGTRRSPLALAQTHWVQTALEACEPGLRVEVVPLSTSGDRHQRGVLGEDFTDTIDAALLRGDVDFAVHSAKDLPAQTRRGLMVAAYPRREDPRDALVVRTSASFRTLPPGARVGSSSARRRAQLLRRRPDLNVVELRGNVDTRLLRVREKELDGAVLAYAGLRRLNRASEACEVFTTREMLPAPGQGALAVETRTRDQSTARLLRHVDHPPTRICVTSERRFVEAMGGDCTVPMAACATLESNGLRLRAAVYSPDGSHRLAVNLVGPAASPASVARRAARYLQTRGAQELWSHPADARPRT
jgi:hydroxymethylbilane synthase